MPSFSLFTIFEFKCLYFPIYNYFLWSPNSATVLSFVLVWHIGFWLKPVKEKKGPVGCFCYSILHSISHLGLRFVHKWSCTKAAVLQVECLHRDVQRKLFSSNDLQTTIVVNAQLWPWAGSMHWSQMAGRQWWGAMWAPMWESGGLGSVSILPQRLLGRCESVPHWATFNTGYSCSSVSSLTAESCYSWHYSSFFVFPSPTVSALRLGLLLGSAVYAEETFLIKVLSRIADRSGGCLGEHLFFEISNLPVWTQKTKVVQVHLVWLSKTITGGLLSAHYCCNTENY